MTDGNGGSVAIYIKNSLPGPKIKSEIVELLPAEISQVLQSLFFLHAGIVH